MTQAVLVNNQTYHPLIWNKAVSYKTTKQRLVDRLIDGPSENDRSNWFFSELKADARAELEKAWKPIQYEKGETIMREGAPSHGAYLVRRGFIKVFQKSPEGKQLIVKLAGPGDLLGEGNVFGSDTCLVSAQALEPTEVAFIARGDFLDLLGRHPALAFTLMVKLAQEINILRYRLLEATYEGGKQKIARLLLELEKKYGTENGADSPLRIRLSRADIGAMTGLSCETTIRVLSELESRGLIQTEASRIILIDKDTLHQLTEPMPPAFMGHLR
ncbi:Crp/Fnr family transcriptional regulator [Candidatus Acetothermia bacterium]|nr:Crp/Fnr family transcriptional regulator [Candidatus Acetothermia bacterium]